VGGAAVALYRSAAADERRLRSQCRERAERAERAAQAVTRELVALNGEEEERR
jgi:hypothetical protein